MFSSIMDALCGAKHFLGMNWAYMKGNPLIHVYYLGLWETKYKNNFENICNKFISTLVSILSCEPTSYMFECAREVILGIGMCHLTCFLTMY